MNKSQLVEKTVMKLREADIPAGYTEKCINKVVDIIVAEITNSLAAGEKVSIANFGTLKVAERPERIYVLPDKEGREVLSPARNTVKFTAGKGLVRAVNHEV